VTSRGLRASRLLQSEDHVAFAHALVYLEADVVSGPSDLHLLVLELDPVDALVEVGRVTAHVHGVADAQLAVLDHHRAGVRVRPEVRDGADALGLRSGDGAAR
jgi:hypothetical protein